MRSEACLICGDRDRAPVVDLGATPLANAYLEEVTADEASYPLEVVRCRRCHLVQLTEIVPPEILFADYAYVTGTSSTMIRHCAELAAGHVRRFGLAAEDLVVEIASNDGTLLAAFAERGTRTLGIEPAENLVALARDRGVESIPRFFGDELARELRAERGPAALICANNVLAHVPDPTGALAGCRHLTEPAGVVSVEVPWLAHLLDRLEYDTIYHEHLSYFSVRALAAAFERAGLAIFDVEELPVHGGTVRILARCGQGHGPAVERFVAAERERGMDDDATWRTFARRVASNRDALRATLTDLRNRGRSVAAYGAPAKGNTLLNYCGIGTDLVAWTVDRNPLKVGRYTPGMHLPIREVSTLAAERPDVTLILPWNIAPEIVAQEAEYRGIGGRFMTPIPEPRILS